jgi:hypothetical protein
MRSLFTVEFKLLFLRVAFQSVSFFSLAYLSHRVKQTLFVDLMFVIAVLEMMYPFTRYGIPEFGLKKFYDGIIFDDVDKIVYQKAFILALLIEFLLLIIFLAQPKLFASHVQVVFMGLLFFFVTCVDYNIIKSSVINGPIYTAIRWTYLRPILFSLMIFLLASLEVSNQNYFLSAYLLSYGIPLLNTKIYAYLFIIKNPVLELKNLIKLNFLSIIFIQVIGVVVNTLDFYIIRKIYPQEVYGYSLAFKLVSFVAIVTTSLSPQLTKNLHDFFLDKIGKNTLFSKFRNIFFISLMASILAFFISVNPFFSIKMFFNGYEKISSFILLILILPKMLELIGGVAGTQLLYMGNYSFLIRLSLLLLALKLSLSLILMYFFGVIGLIMATSLALILIYVLQGFKLLATIESRHSIM